MKIIVNNFYKYLIDQPNTNELNKTPIYSIILCSYDINKISEKRIERSK